MVTNKRQSNSLNKVELFRSLRKRFVQVFVLNIGFIGGLLFVSAGTLRWPLAWLYIGATVAILLINMLVLLRVNPAVIVARAQKARNQGRWHTIVSLLGGLFSYIVLTIVAGLDFRFGWTTPYTRWLVGGALVVMAAGNAIMVWGMAVNKHFETGVRVQSDRAQQVVTDGPYQYVRHPGYVGMFLSQIATPIALGSLWALIPGVLAILMLVLRTALEDRMLRRDLPGYAEYAQRVRYRLLPGVW